MSTLNHNTFQLAREYPVPPATVFRHFSEEALKRKWFGGDEGWTEIGHEMDFRGGGAEWDEGRFEGGDGVAFTSRFDAVYHDIVEDQRLVYSYDMHVNGVHLSVSVASIELTPTAGGTLLTLTEQGVYFDGHEDPALREQGTKDLLEALGRALAAA